MIISEKQVMQLISLAHNLCEALLLSKQVDTYESVKKLLNQITDQQTTEPMDLK